MTDKDRRLTRGEKEYREQTDKIEGKKSFRLLSQLIALIICLLLSFTVWAAVHYRVDKKDDSVADGREANGEITEVYTVL